MDQRWEETLQLQNHCIRELNCLYRNAALGFINIGGVKILAVRLGRGDTEGANHVFRNGIIFLVIVSAVHCFTGTVLAGPVCTMLGANETFHQLCVDYLFWYSLFIIPSGLSVGMQNYCRNDGSPGLAASLSVRP